MRMCSCRGTAGFAHVSCLAEQAKILFVEAEENNLGENVLNKRLERWWTCGLCKQEYHGVVRCALGWACWKTYADRPERDTTRVYAMRLVASGLSDTDQAEDALSVQGAELATLRRLGATEHSILVAQNNLANTYEKLGQHDQALRMKRDIYSGRLKLLGEEDRETLIAANNYANTLLALDRFEEAKLVMRKTVPVARRILGRDAFLTLTMSGCYADALMRRGDPSATLDDLHEAVRTLEDAARIAQRVLGGAHPTAAALGQTLQNTRTMLAVRNLMAARISAPAPA